MPKMPVEVKGVRETVKQLRKFEPESLKAMNKEIRGVMVPLRNKARGYVVAAGDPPGNMYNWSMKAEGTKITAKTSMFREQSDSNRPRLFPLYDAQLASKGIFYSQAPSKRNKSGYRALYWIANATASGAIYETAGRKAGSAGNAGGRSNNPEASSQFIRRMGPLYGDRQPEKGRAIFRAWYEDKGKAQDAAFKAIEKTINGFNRGAYALAA